MIGQLQQYNEHMAELLHQNVSNQPNAQTFLAQWKDQGLPHRRLEAWKYTTDFSWVTKLTKLNPSHKSVWTDQLKNKLALLAKGFQYWVVFLDGQYVSEATQLPKSCQISQIKNKQQDHSSDNPFIFFNQILSQEQSALKIGANNSQHDEILIVNLSSESTAASYHNYQWSLQIAANAQVKIVEVSLLDESQAASNCMVKIELLEHAQLDYSRLLLARPNNVSHHFIHATIGAKAQFNFNYVATGAKQVRQELHFDIIGESAIVNANGLYDVQGEEHHDLHCRFLHKVPNTEGHYYFKGSLRDKSHGVFTCDIDIAHQAQKTNAELLNKNLLLGERAKIDTRPQLNVFADDVKAGHGATIGRISDEELFYLESRGIDRHRAFELLCQGFVDDIFQRLPESHRLWMLQQWQIWRKQKVAE